MPQEKKPKISFIVPYPENLVPGQRFRYEQYLSYLQNYFIIEIYPFLNSKTHEILYKKGNFFSKLYRFSRSLVKRFIHLFKIKDSDIVFIYREASLIGPPVFEWIIANILRKKIIFDFDDSIWLPSVSEANKAYGFLKSTSKTRKIISISSMVLAGNKYLAEYALKYNNNVVIIPTTIDTYEYIKVIPPDKNHNQIIIGWSGSITTLQHFEFALPVLRKIKNRYNNQIKIKVIGDVNYKNEELGIRGIGWRKETEIFELSTFDIGIMPLPNDEWAKGKCGLKGLQYMALEIATVMSPVGVNTEIISDGENGFLAGSEDEWFQKLSRLIESSCLRDKLGKAGRETVVEKYSVESQKQRYVDVFQAVVNS
jgi:glycosyltransferase involved in cell wall biosynthesis